MFAAPSGKTNHTGRCWVLARGLSTNFGGNSSLLAALSTRFPRSSRQAQSAVIRQLLAVIGSFGPSTGRTTKRPKEHRVRSLRHQCKHRCRRFRSRCPFRQCLHYGRVAAVPSRLSTRFEVRATIRCGLSTSFPRCWAASGLRVRFRTSTKDTPLAGRPPKSDSDFEQREIGRVTLAAVRFRTRRSPTCRRARAASPRTREGEAARARRRTWIRCGRNASPGERSARRLRSQAQEPMLRE